MWYGGEERYGGTSQTGYATSIDGINWKKHPDNPVLSAGPSGSWDDGGPRAGTVIKDGEIFRMWFNANNNGITRIGYAESTNGTDWQKSEDVNPVLDIGPSGEWDSHYVIYPMVLKEGASFAMWYSGDSPSNDGAYRIGLAFAPYDPIPVYIDIKPGSYPNCINNNGHGVIPVAILGNFDFDVDLIDPESVVLEGLMVKAVGKGNKLLAHYEDVNLDGFTDLVLQIQDVDGAFQEGTTEAILMGSLYSGTPIEGTDEICIVP